MVVRAYDKDTRRTNIPTEHGNAIWERWGPEAQRRLARILRWPEYYRALGGSTKEKSLGVPILLNAKEIMIQTAILHTRMHEYYEDQNRAK